MIKGETKIGCTEFGTKMKDNNHYAFGKTFHFNYFDIPEGYQPSDIEKVINHSYIGLDSKIKSYNGRDSNDFDISQVQRDKPFFECHVDGHDICNSSFVVPL